VEGGPKKVLKESLDAKAADEMKKKLEEGGAKIEVRPV
jgi:ribosomal protein L7/L12